MELVLVKSNHLLQRWITPIIRPNKGSLRSRSSNLRKGKSYPQNTKSICILLLICKPLLSVKLRMINIILSYLNFHRLVHALMPLHHLKKIGKIAIRVILKMMISDYLRTQRVPIILIKMFKQSLYHKFLLETWMIWTDLRKISVPTIQPLTRTPSRILVKNVVMVHVTILIINIKYKRRRSL